MVQTIASKAFFKILCLNATACCRLWAMLSSPLALVHEDIN